MFYTSLPGWTVSINTLLFWNLSLTSSPSFHQSGLDAAEKKFGGGKIDPVKHRALNEKITDGARKYFEKITG